MMTIKLFRTTGFFQEEYGRVVYDGQNVSYEGLSDVFIKYLEYGLYGPDGKKYKPSDGLNFLQTLKNAFSDLVATEG